MHKQHTRVFVALVGLSIFAFCGCDVTVDNGGGQGGNITRDEDGGITGVYTGGGTVTINGQVVSGGGPVVKGSGVSATEVRDVTDFNQISFSTAINANITVGGEQSVTVTAEDNILPKLKTEVNNNVLSVHLSGATQTSLPVKVDITVPDLTSLTASGSCNVKTDGIDATTFKTVLSGACKLTVVGKTDSFDCNVSGASHVSANELVARNVKVITSGAAHAKIYAVDSVDAGASGASSIRFAGEPTDVKKNKSGASSIKAL